MATLPLRIHFRRCSDLAGPPPAHAHHGDAGLDLRAAIAEPVVVHPGSREPIPTGWAVALPPGFAGLICPRSGLQFRHGIVGGIGVVDSGFTGEIQAILWNFTRVAYKVQPGERVAQILVLPVAAVEAVEVEELGETARGVGGFGSTGR
jgi:dUTP pyrophosphatase